MQDKGNGKEWGVKSIKSKQDDGHGNIEFLVEWDGNWVVIGLTLRNMKRTLGSLFGCTSDDLDSVNEKGDRDRDEREMTDGHEENAEYMKHTSIRLRWTMVISNAGFKWLRFVFGEAAIMDPLKLLTDCRRNVPVYNFISFIFYFVNPLWACRYATQCSDSDMMDFVWKYSLLVFNVTNKYQYCKGVLQNGLGLFDSEPNIRNIIRHSRFVSESGNPCTGTALDYANELVRRTNVMPTHSIPYNICDGYLSSRLGLTPCMICVFIELRQYVLIVCLFAACLIRQ
jgi:hypothetical protein